jgi:putative ABC transport system permease protein
VSLADVTDARNNPESGPWYQIVGVVRDLSVVGEKSSEDAILYRPVSPVGDMRVLVRAKGDAADVASLVRRAAIETDPTLRVDEVKALERIEDADIQTHRFFITIVAIVAVALMLATAGIYALMSFTLARRTREIGIRAALGAAPQRIVTTIFSRAFVQVGAGVVIGSVPGGALLSVGVAEAGGGDPWLMVGGTAASAAFVLAVALLACIVPARRALRIQPTEALRAEA